MNFIRDIKNSIYSPTFYREVLKKSFGAAFGYYVLLSLILALISVIFIIPSLISFQKDIPQFVNSVVNSYPEELEVTIKNGVVSTNVKEPYYIPLPEKDSSDPSIQNLVVIDTKTPFSAAQFKSYKTVAWLTKDTIIYKSNNNEFRVYNLSTVENLTVNKGLVQMMASKVMPFVNYVTPLLSLFVLLGLFIVNLFRLIQILILALLIWVMAKILKWGFSYGTSYKLTFYAITLPLIVDMIISHATDYIGFRGFPFMFTLITLIVVFINYSSYTSTKKIVKKK